MSIYPYLFRFYSTSYNIYYVNFYILIKKMNTSSSYVFNYFSYNYTIIHLIVFLCINIYILLIITHRSISSTLLNRIGR